MILKNPIMQFCQSIVIISVLSFFLMACSSKERVTSKDELIVFLDSLEREYETACYAMGIANWNSYLKEGPADLNSAKAKFAAIFLDEQRRSVISEWRQRSGSLADELLARRLEMWHRCFIGGAIYADPEIARLENSLQKRVTDFKFVHEGKPITRAQISNRMREERSQRARHKLWQVTGQASREAEEDLVRLVKLRNEKAKQLGFDNYYSLVLHLQAVDEAWLLETLNTLEERSRPTLQAFVDSSKKTLRVKQFRPWDFDFAVRGAFSLPDKYFPADSVFAILHRFQQTIGFPVDSLPIKEYVKDIPYSGLSLAIKIPDDSRFLLNPTKGKGFYETAFHEYGHSLQAVYTQVEFPILKGYEWIPGSHSSAYAEGVADLHKEFLDIPAWLSTYTKARLHEITQYLAGRGIPVLYRMRRLLKDFFFEYEMYKNPDQDLAALEREMFKKYLLVEMDQADPHLFAANIWYTSYPCYFQNYILAGMIATQLQEALTHKYGDERITSPNVAEWIIEHLYTSGETTEWPERIREATGKSLETGPYLRKLGITE